MYSCETCTYYVNGKCLLYCPTGLPEYSCSEHSDYFDPLELMGIEESFEDASYVAKLVEAEKYDTDIWF